MTELFCKFISLCSFIEISIPPPFVFFYFVSVMLSQLIFYCILWQVIDDVKQHSRFLKVHPIGNHAESSCFSPHILLESACQCSGYRALHLLLTTTLQPHQVLLLPCCYPIETWPTQRGFCFYSASQLFFRMDHISSVLWERKNI